MDAFNCHAVAGRAQARWCSMIDMDYDVVLRDVCALLVAAALMSREDHTGYSKTWVAGRAYAVADAMLKERKKAQGECLMARGGKRHGAGGPRGLWMRRASKRGKSPLVMVYP